MDISATQYAMSNFPLSLISEKCCQFVTGERLFTKKSSFAFERPVQEHLPTHKVFLQQGRNLT